MQKDTPTATNLGRGPTLWIKHAEFGGAVFFGVAFIVVMLVGVGVWSHFAMKTQAASFVAALATLVDEDGVEAPAQREARLVRRDDLYHWRAVVWRRTESVREPLIWSVRVRAEQPMRVEEFTLSPYDREQAWALELYDEVGEPSRSKGAP